ncbi:hypothetical protein [Paenibacillus dendritiformis]|uniref:hypothetical protein n=1 Tax=Paenibacillus dendritiformis TaxID=130049 RepID=UPI0020C4EEA3|nr:hypothetical protein [Paenibacillus dendritiformis]CAH8767930.1 hypothetical protein H7S4_000607 [Paenibacillus dendritiformis]
MKQLEMHDITKENPVKVQQLEMHGFTKENPVKVQQFDMHGFTKKGILQNCSNFPRFAWLGCKRE